MPVDKRLIFIGVALFVLIAIVYIYYSTVVLNKLDILMKKTDIIEKKQDGEIQPVETQFNN